MKILSFMKKKDQMDIFVYYAKLMIKKPVKIGIFMMRKASSKWFYELFTNYDALNAHNIDLRRVPSD